MSFLAQKIERLIAIPLTVLSGVFGFTALCTIRFGGGTGFGICHIVVSAGTVPGINKLRWDAASHGEWNMQTRGFGSELGSSMEMGNMGIQSSSEAMAPLFILVTPAPNGCNVTCPRCSFVVVARTGLFASIHNV